MRIDSIALKGLTCFRDPVSLDFTQLPPGLIAIVGENGAGKTTFMEAPIGGVYRRLPTRGKVADSANGKDAFIETGFTFDDLGSFRTRLSLDGVKGGRDAVIQRVVNGVATPINDGKVSTFDPAVEAIFPSFDALLASSFAAQNRAGSFATRNKTERKDLFYTLLGLHRLDRYAKTSREVASVLELRIAQLDGQLRTLRLTAGDELGAQLQAQAVALEADLETARAQHAAAAAAVAALDAELATLRVAVQAHVDTIALRNALEGELKSLDSRRAFYDLQDAELASDRESQLQAIQQRLSAALRRNDESVAGLDTTAAIDAWKRDRLAAVQSEFDALVTDRRARIANNQTIRDQAAAIRNAATTLTAAETALAAAQTALQQARTAQQQIDLEPARAELRRVQALEAELDACQRSAGLLSTVPCGGAAEFASCQFLKDASAARDRAAELLAMDLPRVMADAVQALADRSSEAAAAAGAVAQREQDVHAHQSVIRDHQGLAKRLPDLELAEGRIKDREAEITQAEAKAVTDRAAIEHEAADRLQRRNAQWDRLQAERSDLLRADARDREAADAKVAQTRAVRQRDRDALEARVAVIKGELTTTAGAADAHHDALTAVARKETERADRQSDLTDTSTAVARAEEQVAHLDRRRAEYAAALDERHHLEADVAQLQTDLVEWQALAQVMGKDGLPVLEIDAAGPGVSAEANDLLQASFGGRFVVELVTQEPKADGKGMKEVFELKVYDHERGGEERDLADLSGGEQVIVDSALRFAISLWHNRKNERPVRTAWLDETTGALDPENALRYFAMLRRLHERAGLHHLFFISHNTQVAALADAQLQVANGQVSVAYPPFAPASQAAA